MDRLPEAIVTMLCAQIRPEARERLTNLPPKEIANFTSAYGLWGKISDWTEYMVRNTAKVGKSTDHELTVVLMSVGGMGRRERKTRTPCEN